MEISVIGCGRWGSLITWYLDSIGHSVTLYGRENSKNMSRFLETRSNGLLTLPESVTLTTELSSAVKKDIIVISIGSKDLRSLFEELKDFSLKDKIFVLCMKGIEVGTGKRLSEIAEEYLDESNGIAVWLGPGHVEEFYAGIPNCMVIDSTSEEVKEKLINAFQSPLIRFYYGNDIIGNEIGAAAKNVIGIAAGMLDGLCLSSLKGALMARATREVSRLIKALGGNELSAYGLCHLGDYEATVFSKYSHNRKFGESFIKGEKFELLAEGYYTADALVRLGKKYSVDLPITEAVYSVIYENAEPKEVFEKLFTRSIKKEF